MGFGIAILAVFGVGLLVSAFDDDDDTGTTSEPTDGDQNLSTTDEAETIETGTGNDIVRSQGGNDLVNLGAGDDRAFAGQGADALFGAEGNDLIRGEGGMDQLFGGTGEDTLFGDTGNDILYGANVLDEDALFDQTTASGFLIFDNTGSFDADADTGESDTVIAGVGDDTVYAGANDEVSLGDGADEVQVGDWIAPGSTVDIVDFDPSQDRLVYSVANGAPQPTLSLASGSDGTLQLLAEDDVVANLLNLTLDDASDVQLSLVERPATNTIETQLGTDGADVLRGTTSNDFVLADDGADRVFGREGADVVVGGAGNDLLRGESGNDTLFADAGEDTLFGDVGDDLLVGADIFVASTPAELVRAAGILVTDGAPLNFADLLDIGADTGEADTLVGGVGDDVFFAGNADVVDTGSGIDAVIIGDWMDLDGPPVEIVDFDPAQDTLLYSFDGDAAPTVFFAEDDDGTAVVEVAISDTENRVIARFPNIGFDALNSGNALVLLPV
ncbi:calcium-binding protein [uncultured Tateyamaria sp.]|uniref:calcium-binding protein n=1 Tax=uncultured Tateyamaria sp. TaxID=455651 RepID=UPI00260661A5|nr:calcium-binding protein [uncultured Tateyamaria sp.]